MKGRAVTSEQKRWHDLLARHVGCIACRVSMGIVNTYCSIHHVDGRTKPHAHWYVLPLCAGHHQNGYGGAGFTGVAVHPYKARFEAEYGTQSDLLSKCASILAEEGHDNLLKGLLDSLTKAGAWDDDGLVDDLRIVRGEVKAGGEVLVTIEALA
ncbi:Ref family recombination enhancement nuclease [Pseudomonas aeruginosa]